MQLTKQQKAGVAVAALAVAALGVDRFLLRPAGPAAAAAQTAAAVSAEAAPPDAGGVMTVSAGPTFAQRLEAYAQQRQIEPGAGVPDLFGREVWRVSAVIGQGENGAVRLGDDLVRVGQIYKGATLLSVDRNGGTFRKSGHVFRAEIDRPVTEQPSDSTGDGA